MHTGIPPIIIIIDKNKTPMGLELRLPLCQPLTPNH